jgi:predicted lipoprotein with Yx(FWY)xxD motif
MQRAPLFAGTAFVAVLLLAACGGGGSSNPPAPGPASATIAPTTAPTTSATNPPSMPTTATVAGVTVYVGSNGHTLYETTGDGNDVSNCTSANGCTPIWPPYTAPAGTTAPSGTPFTIFTRSDGTMQWAVNGHPMYDYSGDTAAGTDNGNGLSDQWGHWSQTTPSSSTTAPSPSPTSSATSAPTATPYAMQTHRP